MGRRRRRGEHAAGANGKPSGTVDGAPPPKKSARKPARRVVPSREEIKKQRRSLPIYQHRKELVELVRDNRVCVVVGPTGSGKTTQLVQYLLEDRVDGGRRIAVTQPRRVAATTVAQRVADEVGCELGGKVGYTIRFDDQTSEATKIQFMTDGILMRETLGSRVLAPYGVVIIDEAHERTLHTDVLLGLLRDILRRREDLRVVVMSATLDAGLFADFFDDAPIYHVQGRQYDVDVLYTAEPQDDYQDAVLACVTQIHAEEPAGDVLVFLTGQDEIENMVVLINAELKRDESLVENRPMQVCPLYAALPPEQQMKAFAPATVKNARKVILATNIAETSVTINGIRYVVDPGLAKTRTFNPRIGIDSLLIQPISKAQCDQRAGRAGREAPGRCYRLFPEVVYDDMRDHSVPEIQRANLASVVLQLKALGIEQLLTFPFVQPPSQDALVKALELLYALGALDRKGELTDPLGKNMAKLPLDPPFGKALLVAPKMGCAKEVLSIVAMLSVDTVFHNPREKQEQAQAARRRCKHPEGDHLTLLRVWNEFNTHNADPTWCFENFINFRALRRAGYVREQLEKHLKRIGVNVHASSSMDTDTIRKCLVAGFFRSTAVLQPDKTYRTLLDNQTVAIHPTSAMHGKKPQTILYNELVSQEKKWADRSGH